VGLEAEPRREIAPKGIGERRRKNKNKKILG
jgi:hypothetical protein